MRLLPADRQNGALGLPVRSALGPVGQAESPPPPIPDGIPMTGALGKTGALSAFTGLRSLERKRMPWGDR